MFEAQIGDQIEYMMRNYQCRRGSRLAACLPRDGPQRLAMQVIEVRVRHQHNIHWRQIAQIQSRLPQALQNEQPAREVGIDDDVLSANLQKKTGVADEGDAEFAIRNQFRFVGLTGARGDGGMPHQAGELAGAFAQRSIFQRRL